MRAVEPFARIALLVLGLLLSAAATAGLRVGAPAPPLTLHTLNGKAIPLSSLRGDVVILTFWATWCGPCQQELPLLSRYARAHADQGLRVLAFSLDDPSNLPEVQQMAAKMPFPVGLLGSAYAGGYGRVWRLPVSFVIDRQGRLVYDGWEHDDSAWTDASLTQVVTPLLARSAAVPAR
jgi:Thiol-disulfide isomerase and thioredoxins